MTGSGMHSAIILPPDMPLQLTIVVQPIPVSICYIYDVTYRRENLHSGVMYLKPILRVLSEWDRRVIHGLGWLEALGMGRVAVHRACASGELGRRGSGVFGRSTDSLEWEAAVEALQVEFRFPVHIGGLSSLELLGSAHQLRLHRKEIDLISYRNRNLPVWVTGNDWGVKFQYHRSRLFKSDIFLQDHVEGRFHLLVSSRETGILEYIDSLEFDSTFESLERDDGSSHDAFGSSSVSA